MRPASTGLVSPVRESNILPLTLLDTTTLIRKQ
jgi:hypothetical protein